jgi:hypothetical protein|tara:strand:- start:371 stop:565 length:195 start_codon:yes stop_codon:yes gene_type:complete
MAKVEMELEALKAKLHHIGMMGQWYQRYDISKSAQEAKEIIEDIEKELNKPHFLDRGWPSGKKK